MAPYFWATRPMAPDTPDERAPTRKLHSLRSIIFSATRVPVAGSLPVSWWIHWIFLPRTPPCPLNSEMAMHIPSFSLAPLFAYWPVASVAMPIVMGLSRRVAYAWLCFQGPKKAAPAPAPAIRREVLQNSRLVHSFLLSDMAPSAR